MFRIAADGLDETAVFCGRHSESYLPLNQRGMLIKMRSVPAGAKTASLFGRGWCIQHLRDKLIL
jgi:hypothetical protein